MGRFCKLRAQIGGAVGPKSPDGLPGLAAYEGFLSLFLERLRQLGGYSRGAFWVDMSSYCGRGLTGPQASRHPGISVRIDPDINVYFPRSLVSRPCGGYMGWVMLDERGLHRVGVLAELHDRHCPAYTSHGCKPGGRAASDGLQKLKARVQNYLQGDNYN